MIKSNEPTLKNCEPEIQATAKMVAWVEVGDERIIMVLDRKNYRWYAESTGINYGGFGGKTALSAIESIINSKLNISYMGVI